MQPLVFDQLRSRRDQISKTWATLLMAEPVTTPMAEPHLLAHLFDRTLDRIFKSLRRPLDELQPKPFHCACGRSPYLAFFRAVEQALLETLVLVHVESASRSGAAKWARDFAELRAVVRSIGNEEIGLFGSVCQRRRKCLSGAQCPESATNSCCLADGTSAET